VGAAIALFAVRVTFATGLLTTFHTILDASVNASSVFNTAPDIVVKLLALAVNTFDAALVPSVARSE